MLLELKMLGKKSGRVLSLDIGYYSRASGDREAENGL
jgi:hypothetical protein